LKKGKRDRGRETRRESFVNVSWERRKKNAISRDGLEDPEKKERRRGVKVWEKKTRFHAKQTT
jgi:hypothetical protein